MNQEQRDHKKNELEKLIASTSPWFEKNKETLVYGVCGVMLVFSVGYYLTQTSSNASSAGWGKFLAANDIEQFGTVASQHPDEAPGQWALLTEADILLNQGVRGSFTDREGAVSDLKAAEEKYRELLKKSGLPEPLQERTLIGLARCLETLSGEDTSAAVKAYEEFVSRFPDSIYVQIAQEQVESLTEDEGKAFYAWYQEQNPKPADPAKPQDGLPSGHPPVDPNSLINLPPIPSMLKRPEAAAPAFPEDAGESTVPSPPPLPDDEETTSGGTAPALPDIPEEPGTPTPDKPEGE